ncbi:carboxylesterase family protein [Streptomyces himalayensis]|uniref:Carboxylesterase family protein n=1 Tax=Streptomyces himalayensis subsp. himalayensis TaxID=2756131 RepID=A0A7W0I8X4_9ACTN|nr:carboxylesterase family protein [Streptomyces himalayensis]MBA2946760.1 carboxylesterase family protein [Streptomyces himalayensis subsp. himalayensis]
MLSRRDPRAASTVDILAAQSEAARHAAGRLQLNSAPQFMPVAGVGPLPDEAGWAARLAHRAPAVDVIVGTTGREMSAFYTLNPALRRLRRVRVLGPATADAVERAASAAVFDRPARHLAVRLTKAGARVWAYQFDYSASDSPFGATHCIELPFLLGTDADWATAPMLAGAHPDDLDTLGRSLRAAWLGFIRTGAPTADTPWPQFTADTPAIRHWHL